MVLGAGRGPLVRQAVAVMQKLKLNFKIYAIDKNPHSVLTLQS